MAKYVTLFRFTEQGIRSVKESPSRLKAMTKKAEAAGVRVIAAFYTQGPYDGVLISEAADEKKATALVLGNAAQGNVTTTTMRAFDVEEFEQIVKLIP
ncbi:MAG TPA: GYD domain-containing protein [Vicinamibacterales bacterium]